MSANIKIHTYHLNLKYVLQALSENAISFAIAIVRVMSQKKNKLLEKLYQKTFIDGKICTNVVLLTTFDQIYLSYILLILGPHIYVYLFLVIYVY